MNGRPVKEVYHIDEDALIVKSAESDYWASALKFWNTWKDRSSEGLSFKQKNWLDKIQQELDE